MNMSYKTLTISDLFALLALHYLLPLLVKVALLPKSEVWCYVATAAKVNPIPQKVLWFSDHIQWQRSGSWCMLNCPVAPCGSSWVGTAPVTYPGKHRLLQRPTASAVTSCSAGSCTWVRLRVCLVQFHLGGRKSVVDFMLNKKKTGNGTRFLCTAILLPAVLCLIRAILVTWCLFKM